MSHSEASQVRQPGSLSSYDGYLSISSISPEGAEMIHKAATERGLSVEVSDSSLEFEYRGRDANGFVVNFLADVAGIVGTASGEIRCEISADGEDSRFEFFSIQESKLFRQRGVIVRGAVEVVSPRQPTDHRNA